MLSTFGVRGACADRTGGRRFLVRLSSERFLLNPLFIVITIIIILISQLCLIIHLLNNNDNPPLLILPTYPAH